MIESQDRYIKEVYYFDPQSAIQDIIALINGTMTLETLRKCIKGGHTADEAEYGSGIYRTQEVE